MEKTGPERLREFLQTATEEELAEVHAASDKFRGVGPKVVDYLETQEMIDKLDQLFKDMTDAEFDAIWDEVESKRCDGPRAEDFLRAHDVDKASRDLVEVCQRMVLRSYSGNSVPVDTSRIVWTWDHPDIQEIRRCLEVLGLTPLPIKELEDKMLEGYDAHHQ